MTVRKPLAQFLVDITTRLEGRQRSNADTARIHPSEEVRKAALIAANSYALALMDVSAMAVEHTEDRHDYRSAFLALSASARTLLRMRDLAGCCDAASLRLLETDLRNIQGDLQVQCESDGAGSSSKP